MVDVEIKQNSNDSDGIKDIKKIDLSNNSDENS